MTLKIFFKFISFIGFIFFSTICFMDIAELFPDSLRSLIFFTLSLLLAFAIAIYNDRQLVKRMSLNKKQKENILLFTKIWSK